MANRGKILLADDEDTFLQSTADLLRDAGYECDCVTDSVSARECLSRDLYDLLISDINMPGNVQLEFLKEVHRQDQLLPLIVITGYPSVPTAVGSLRLAAVDYLQKPINIQELLGLVGNATNKSHVLRSIRHTRDEMQTATKALEGLETYTHSVQSGREAVVQGRAGAPCFEHVVEHLVSVSANLKNTIDQMKQDEAPIGSVEKIESVCSACLRYREMLYQTAHVLTKTKDSFKSKALGELRRQIEHVLKPQ